jgi:beta-lactamase class A
MNVRLLTPLLLSLTSLFQLAAPAADAARQARPARAATLSDLRPRLQEIAAASGGRVGAAVEVLETGDAVSVEPEGRFPMQSVYKLPIAMAVLQRVDSGRLKLDEKVRVAPEELVPGTMHSPLRDKNPKGGFEVSLRELLRAMMIESDGTACDVLLRVVGGATRVDEYLRGLGLDEVKVATTEKEMSAGPDVQYRNWATPRGMLKLLRTLHEGRGLAAESRALLLQLMADSVTGPRRLKGMLPAGTLVAHKTGTSGTVGGLTRATNDVGIITLPDGRHLAVAVFVSDSKADADTREGTIARIARAAWDASARPN